MPLLKPFLQFLDELRQDTHYGLRLLLRSPGFAFVVMVVLGFGIGATGTIFSFISSLVIRPLAIEDVRSIVQVVERFPGETERHRVAYANFLDWQDQNNVFEHIAAFRFDFSAFAAGKEPQRILLMKASAAIFPLLRTRMAFGRVFTPQDDRPGAESVVVLSNAFWRSHLGGDPDIVGQSVRLDSRPATVIGILATAPDYFGLAQIWTAWTCS